jgi:hypothetical protein
MGTIMGSALLAYLTLVDNQDRGIRRSEAWNSAIAVAEAGIEEALAHTWYNQYALGTNDWNLTNNAYTKSRALDSTSYFLAAISNVQPPVIYCQGFVRIPRSPAYLPPRTVRVVVGPNTLFKKGMVAKGAIDLSGNNIKTDSFDSGDPAFSTGGQYDPAKTKDNGDVATDSAMVDSLNVWNANIFGHVATGPGGSVLVGPNGAVGSKAWQTAGNKGIQDGWFADDMNVTFFDIPVPYTTGLNPVAGNVAGTNYQHVLATGNYIMDDLDLKGNKAICVSGNAVLYVKADFSISGNAFLYIAPGGTLTLYVGGATKIAGNGVANAGTCATNFAYYGLPSNTSIDMGGNAAFVGMIYAPNAALSLGGGGASSDYDFVGASVTASVKLNGHYNFHYDEAVGRNGPTKGCIVTSWREL